MHCRGHRFELLKENREAVTMRDELEKALEQKEDEVNVEALVKFIFRANMAGIPADDEILTQKCAALVRLFAWHCSCS